MQDDDPGPWYIPDYSQNVVINACAGTGKTTTIKQAVLRHHGVRQPKWFSPTDEQQAIIDTVLVAPLPKRTHMTSFSTDAADQLATGLIDGVTSSSTYGMGLSIAKRFGIAGKVDRGDWKYGRFLTEFVASRWQLESRWPNYRMDLIDLCKKARLDLIRTVDYDSINRLADHYGVDLPSAPSTQELAVDALNHMLTQGLEHDEEFDYTDMVYIPIMKYLVGKMYDHLYVDEYQDMGLAQQEMCYRVARRVIAIGDPWQAIYGFIGADANATESFAAALGKTKKGHIKLPLTYTRRCPKAVVEMANSVLTTGLRALPEAPDGRVTHLDDWEFNPLKTMTPKDMLICPTNAPLVSLIFKFQKLGIKACIRKSDIVQKMISYVNRHTKGIDELRKSIDRVLEQARPQRTKKQRMQWDMYSSMKELADESLSSEDVIRGINGMFAPSSIPGVIRLSTVHRAKGQEAEKVIFWDWNLCGQYAEMDWEKKQALNLKYVGITRAMKELVLVRGSR